MDFITRYGKRTAVLIFLNDNENIETGYYGRHLIFTVNLFNLRAAFSNDTTENILLPVDQMTMSEDGFLKETFCD